MRLDHDFFCTGTPNNVKDKKEKVSASNVEENKDANEDEEMGVSYLLTFQIIVNSVHRHKKTSRPFIDNTNLLFISSHCILYLFCYRFSVSAK